ncbi:MAG: signal peptide peptidase SppA [Thermodesulfobacteriota bacterium]
MKKSRTGTGILFLVCVVILFIVLAVILSAHLGSDSDEADLGSLFAGGNKIGVIPIEGAITSSDRTLKQLRKFRKKKSIKAIVLRINSPGGSVAPAQEIYHEIGKVRLSKPVVASMETIGTSAAYYIAGNTDEIVCSRGTITGSIGVIMMMADIHKVIERLGVGVNIIKAGKFKDLGTGVRPLTDEERSLLEGFAKHIHTQFIDDIAKARAGKIDRKKLESVADGSFFSGERAKELGLVDTIGNFYDAVDAAARRAGVKGEPELVYPKKKWEGYLDLLVDSMSRGIVKAAEHVRALQQVPVPR